MKGTFILVLLFLLAITGHSQNMVMYQNGQRVDTFTKGTKETALEKVVFLSTDAEMKGSTSLDDLEEMIEKTTDIFLTLFKDSKSAGRIMVEIKMLKKGKAEIQFAVMDDIDLTLMGRFEKEINEVDYPQSRKHAITVQLIYKVNSFNAID